MGLLSFPTNLFFHRPLSTSPPFTTKSSVSYINPWINLKKQPQKAQVLSSGSLSPLWDQAALRRRGVSSDRRRLSPVVSATPESTEPGVEPRVEDRRAVETVQKLYIAIKNKNMKEVSELIGDECRCFCNFISASQPFNGKKVGDRFQCIITHCFCNYPGHQLIM